MSRNFPTVAENIRKPADEISLKYTKYCHKNFTNLWKVFDEFSVNFRETVGDSYSNKYSTILETIFRKFVFHNMLRLMTTDFEVQYAFSRSNTALNKPRINQSNCEVVLAIQ